MASIIHTDVITYTYKKKKEIEVRSVLLPIPASYFGAVQITIHPVPKKTAGFLGFYPLSVVVRSVKYRVG